MRQYKHCVFGSVRFGLFILMMPLIAAPLLGSDRAPCDDAYIQNGMPDYSEGYASDRHPQPSNVDAWLVDDVIVPESIVLTGLTFWTVTNVSYVFGDVGDFIILNDNGGIPGQTIMEARNVPLSRIATGNTPFSLPEYIFTFENLDIPLTAGAYWIGMRPFNTVNDGMNYHLAAGVTGSEAFFRSTGFGYPSWTSSSAVWGTPIGLAFCIQAYPYDFSTPGLTTWHSETATPFEYTRFDAEFVPGPAHEEWANCVYFLGGRSSTSSESPDIYRYDPISKMYNDTGHDMVEDVSNYTANLILDDGLGNGPALYIFGGYNVDATLNTNLVQRYYPAIGLVEVVASDPMPLMFGAEYLNGCGSVVIDDVVYVFGGRALTTAPYFADETWSFNPRLPAGSRWTNLNVTLTEPKALIMTAVQGSRIFCFGGDNFYDGSVLTPSNVVESLDIANIAAGWTLHPDLPFIIGEGQGFHVPYQPGIPVSFMRKMAIAGGGEWPNQSSEALLYDIPTDIWNAGFPDLNQARRNHAGVCIPLTTDDPDDGLPGFWVFGGRVDLDDPPFGLPEYYSIPWIPSPTPAVSPTPTAQPTATPMPCTELGCRIEMPSTMFHAGDPCFCTLAVCNPSSNTYNDVPVFAILDVYGMYFFAPDFSSYNHYTLDISPGIQLVPVLLEFAWPDNAGAASGIVWYAAMTNAGITELFGTLGQFQFGWE